MTALSARKDVMAGAGGAERSARHRPEQTLVYRIVEQYYPAFVSQMAAGGRVLPAYVQREWSGCP